MPHVADREHEVEAMAELPRQVRRQRPVGDFVETVEQQRAWPVQRLGEEALIEGAQLVEVRRHLLDVAVPRRQLLDDGSQEELLGESRWSVQRREEVVGE